MYQYSSKNTLYKDENGNQRSKDVFTKYVDQVLNNLKNNGFNTIFVQMLSHGNAMFPSEDLLPSPYGANGPSNYSQNVYFTYDPMKIFVDEANKIGIDIHAWLNPMRLLTATEFENAAKLPSFQDYTLIKWYNDPEKNGTYIVKAREDGQSEDRYYLNPAYPDVRDFIAHEAAEVASKYNLAGVHWDDYFYITIPDETDDLAFDNIAFDQFCPTVSPSLKRDRTYRRAWRRDNVNKLVKEVYDVVKSVDQNLRFGISPVGNVDTNQRGYLCADVINWGSHEGYVDYLMPEIYWSNYYAGLEEESFKYRFNYNYMTWCDLVCNDNVDLYVGMNVNRCCEGWSETDPGWYNHKDNILTQLEFMAHNGKAKGFTFFDYTATFDLYKEGVINENKKAEIDNYLPVIKAYPNI